jgi:hypothetical protein
MKMTLDLPEDLLLELKMAAVKERKTLRVLMAERFRAALARPKASELQRRKKRP